MVRLANRLDDYGVKPKTVYFVDRKEFKSIAEQELAKAFGIDITVDISYDDETNGLMLSLSEEFLSTLDEGGWEALSENSPEWFHVDEWFLNATGLITTLIGTYEFVAYAAIDGEDVNNFTVVIELLK